jgi:hypothetical protein
MAYGDTVKGDFCHMAKSYYHWQTMQTLHDLISANKLLAQDILNDVMAGGEFWAAFCEKKSSTLMLSDLL